MRLEDFDMDAGRAVEVEVFGGKIVRRVGFQITENMLLVSTSDEARNSALEGRFPVGVGYENSKVFFVSE